MWDPDTLIVAPGTIPGRGARAIVRVAGVGLAGLLSRLLDLSAPLPSGPAALLAPLAAAGLGSHWGRLPLAVLYWPGPAGPTGGPLAELQLPCCQPLVEAVVAECCRLGARGARRGEFTLRGFLAGRIDLLQAEAVLAVVEAQGPEELSLALDRLAGGCGRDLRAVRDRLLDLAADVEASIDFADERSPDALGIAPTDFWGDVHRTLEAIGAELGRIDGRIEARDAGLHGRLPRVALCGAPNIGKSSLFNALAGRDAALVADERGTTRDWLEERMAAIGGGGTVEWVLVDTAGRETDVGGEERGGDPDEDARRRAGAESRRADLLLRCRDSAGADGDPVEGSRVIDVLTRCDRAVDGEPVGMAIRTSALTGVGIDLLRAAIADAVAALPRPGGVGERMRGGVAAARLALEDAARVAIEGKAGRPAEEALVAASLVGAIDAIDEVTGATIGNDLVDRIFSRHCIGK